MKWLIAGAAIVAVSLGSAQGQPPPPGYAPIPPPRYEVVPPPPGGRMIWEPGHWHWDGYQYIWIGGHYIMQHRRPLQWIPGRWIWQGRWVWIPAHWG